MGHRLTAVDVPVAIRERMGFDARGQSIQQQLESILRGEATEINPMRPEFAKKRFL